MKPLASVEIVADALRKARARGIECDLLIGAGCSTSAGIPDGDGFANRIKEEFPGLYGQASFHTYAECMYLLPDGVRQDLIARFVDGAVMNYAHVCIAALLREQYVRRVFTTNFDPLVSRACALLLVPCDPYDVACSDPLPLSAIRGTSVFHLHGRSHGPFLVHTLSQRENLEPRLAPLFRDAGINRLWIVVGYGGRGADPVFRQLRSAAPFREGLYWVCRENHPYHNVIDEMLARDLGTKCVAGLDADTFFAHLVASLELDPLNMIDQVRARSLFYIHMQESSDPIMSNVYERQQRLQTELDEAVQMSSRSGPAVNLVGRNVRRQITMRASEDAADAVSTRAERMDAARAEQHSAPPSKGPMESYSATRADVSPRDLGETIRGEDLPLGAAIAIGLPDGKLEIVFPKGTSVPTARDIARVFRTGSEGQEKLEIPMYAVDNVSGRRDPLFKAIVHLPQMLHKGDPIKVRIGIDHEGELHLRAYFKEHTLRLDVDDEESLLE
jgi:hypothetical protein